MLGTEELCTSSSREQEKKSMGIRRVTSSNPCPTLLMGVKRGLLKSLSGASKFIGVLGRVSVRP
eukprot:1150777-Pelagomonas_calceolata.AAC.6